MRRGIAGRECRSQPVEGAPPVEKEEMPMTTNGNRQHAESSPARTELHDVFTEALREALGEVVAHERKHWQREKARMQSEANEIVAELRAKIAELQGEFMRMVNE